MSKNQYFTKGAGSYTCYHCGKQTRETGEGESQFDLCASCYEWEGISNQHSDDNHPGEVWDCEECISQLSRKALSHLGDYRAGTLRYAKGGPDA
jgi:hypothetical protein